LFPANSILISPFFLFRTCSKPNQCNHFISSKISLKPDFSNKKSCYIKTAARFRAPEQPENHAYEGTFDCNPKHGSADPDIEAAAGPGTGIRKLSTV
jgi:hypothetical protein